ncbi:MAG: cell division protein FtsA [Candidatus Omnitrophota bacterium]|nr:cell division protein FtsA [Candidatus Omnitrophota bacterium]
MKKSNIITGLDISSSKISAAALEILDPMVSIILAYESQSSRGVFRGSIIGLDEASNSIARVLTKLKEKTSKDPGDIYVNISGDTVAGEKSRGMVPLSSRGREVTKSDMDKCVNAAGTIRLPFNREIIHRIVLNYSIDDQPSIKNPLGLYASRLSCEMYVITADINHIQNIYKCVDSAGYDIKGIVYSGIADGMSLLEDEWKEVGVLLLNIGASLTELSIFSGGSLSAIGIIPIGASDIKGEPKTSAEFDNIISGVKTKREESLKKGSSIKSAVITGGFAFSEDIIDILEERLSLPVKMGVVRNVQGNISGIDSLRGVTAIGLARYAQMQYQPKPFHTKGLVKDISDKVAEIFNNYF